MQIHRKVRSLASKTLLVTAAGLSAVLLASSPASAAVDDSYVVYNSNACAMIEFVDYGPGAPGGGNNDDYTIIHDYCGDGYGVRGYAWLNGTYLGSKYNGNGQAGAAVVWDPFGNVTGGQQIALQVCNVNGSGGSPFRCSAIVYKTSADG